MRWILPIAFCLPTIGIYSQSNLESSFSYIEEWYDQGVGVVNDPMFAGEVDPLILKSRSTHPYYESRAWNEGEILLGNVTYSGVYFLYNLEKQYLVLRKPNLSHKGGVIVNMLDVKSFQINNKLFRKSETDNSEHFYEVLYDGGNFNLLAFHSKNEEASSSEVVYGSVTKYFIETNEITQVINGRKDLQKIFPDYKSINKRVKSNHKKVEYSRYKEDLMINYMNAFDEEINSK